MGDALPKVVITSGFFNPLHLGHLNLLKAARESGDFLVVIVNNDAQVRVKGSVPFMSEVERTEIIAAIKWVDAVFLSVDSDGSVAESLRQVAMRHSGCHVFAKGGDRNFDNLPDSEKAVCRELGIEVVSGVGGTKVQSSSWLIGQATEKNQPIS